MSKISFDKIQFWLLVAISLIFLWNAPEVWRYSPDGGIYVGTAQAMVNDGRYWFNGHPNLQYYPGLSSLLSLTILVFGLNFHVMHLLTAGVAVAVLWLSRAYFSQARYGLAGLAIPLMIACTGIFQAQAFLILSDGAFLALALAALLFWRNYSETDNRNALWYCLLLVACSSLVRFQGLFLCAAFGGALLLDSLRETKITSRSIATAICLGGLSLLPFAAWTWRNFVHHTPDTINMANRFFFGLKGLSGRSSGFAKYDWVQEPWMYPLYRFYYDSRNLTESIFGSVINDLPFSQIALLSLIGLVIIGSASWLKRSTQLEIIFVSLLGLFFIYSHLKAQNLYTVTRYWLPLLPFILISGALGISLIYRKYSKFHLNKITGLAGVFLLILSLQNGVTGFLDHISPENKAYYLNAHKTINNLAKFVDRSTSPKDAVMTTDVGVLPRVMNRKSYKSVLGGTEKQNYKVITKYDARVLVTLEGFGASQSTINMAKNNPNIFKPLAEFDDSGVGPVGAVYEIDLEQVRRALRDKPLKP